ncbi:hypothetical protein V2I01_15610 [Micromonospora sp. BRA006-A]|nr:hypothetical protein [Micromonospora sp. BRA006-A]
MTPTASARSKPRSATRWPASCTPSSRCGRTASNWPTCRRWPTRYARRMDEVLSGTTPRRTSADR